MKISQILESRDMCNVCGQTPCNCTSVAESQLTEFAPSSGGEGGNYLKALASAWYNHDIDMLKGIAKQGGNALKHIIDAQEAVEKILARGIHCGDGRVRKYSITYNPGFDGVIVSSDDYYNHSDYDDAGNEIDDRTGQPWGPYDYVEFAGNELDEGLFEFAPGSDDNRENDPEDVLFRFAKMWYSAPDVATQQRVEQALAKIGWEIGELESEEGGAFVMRIGDEDGDSYIGWSEEDLAGLDEGKDKKPEQSEADYGDDYQDMVKRVKKLAGLGPLKTVYDPAKRVYKNVPTAEQPKK